MVLFRKILAFIERNLTWLQLLTGGSLLTFFGFVSKVTAERTTWVAEQGPFAIWLAALGGVLFGLLILVALSGARALWIRGSLISKWSAPAQGINPLDRDFQNKRIRILDLVSPIEPVIRGKTFIDCELLGPVNFVFHATRPGSGGFNGVNFRECDLVEVREDVPIRNVIFLEDCNLLRCVVYRATMYVPSDAVAFVKSSLPGSVWLTPANPTAAETSLPQPPSTGA